MNQHLPLVSLLWVYTNLESLLTFCFDFTVHEIQRQDQNAHRELA
jgi:hypothetical protein